jgi:hypothetical protein
LSFPAVASWGNGKASAALGIAVWTFASSFVLLRHVIFSSFVVAVVTVGVASSSSLFPICVKFTLCLPDQLVCIVVIWWVKELDGGLGVSVCHCPDKDKEFVVLVGEEGGVLIAHPFDRQCVGLSDAFDLNLAMGNVGSHQVGVQQETNGVPFKGVYLFGSCSDEFHKFVSRGASLEVFGGWDYHVRTAGCAGEGFYQGADGELFHRRVTVESEDSRHFELIILCDSKVVEDTDGSVCSGDQDDGFKRVQVNLLLEYFGVLNVLRRDVVKLVKSAILGLASFVGKILAPVGGWRRRGHVVCGFVCLLSLLATYLFKIYANQDDKQQMQWKLQLCAFLVKSC